MVPCTNGPGERQPQRPRLEREHEEAEPQPQLVRRQVESELRVRRRPKLASFFSAYVAEFSLVRWRSHPPNIFPVSLSLSERVINFLLSRAFISHAICKNNFRVSSFTAALCTYGSFLLLQRVLAIKANSITSINSKLIFSPRVQREVLGKCGKNSCHSL